MNIRFSALGLILAVPLLLSAAEPAVAQGRPGAGVARQDTTRMRQARPHMGPRAGRAAMMRGGGMMGADHLGPGRLLGLKDELALTDQQVQQLEKLRDGHHSLMQAQSEKMREVGGAMREARSNRDWKALEQGIDEGAKLRVGMAKSIVQLERQSLEVLNSEQRGKYDFWQEGARLFRRQGMQRGMRGREMRRPGMQRMRRAAPPDSASNR